MNLIQLRDILEKFDHRLSVVYRQGGFRGGTRDGGCQTRL